MIRTFIQTDEFVKNWKRLGLNDDDPLTRSACSNIQELDLSGRGITTLAGIEYFTALRKLNCNDN